jgi:tape measure domain-containing protein
MAEVPVTVKLGETGAEITAGKIRRVTKSVKDLQDQMAKQFASGRSLHAPGSLFEAAVPSIRKMSAATSEYTQKSRALTLESKNLTVEMKRLALAKKQVGREVQNTTAHLSLFGRIVASVAITEAARRVLNLADSYINLQNKIRVVTEDQMHMKFVMDELLGVANRSRTSLESVATVYARTARSVKDLGKTQRETLTFTETLSKAIAVGGSTSVEASNAMIQLSQGLSSGTLRGDELRSVMEQLPVVAQLIADKLGVSTGQLKALGAAGKLTSEQVFDAIVEGSTSVEARFKTMTPTVAQAATVFKNNLLAATEALENSMGRLANVILGLGTNMDTLIDTALSLAGVLGVALAARAIGAVIAGMNALTLAMARNPLGAMAVAATMLVAAIAPFADEIKVASNSIVTLQDVGVAAFRQLRDIVSPFGTALMEHVVKPVLGANVSIKSLLITAAKAVDMIRLLDPRHAAKVLSDAVLGNGNGSSNAAENAVRGLFKRAESVADERTTDELFASRRALSQDVMGKLRMDVRGPKRPGAPPKAAGGRTAADIIRELNDAFAVGQTVNDNEREIEKRFEAAMDSLGKKQSATPEQQGIIKDLIRRNLLEEEIAKSFEHRLKLIQEELDAEKELVQLRQEAMAEARGRAQGGLNTAVGILNPNAGVEQQIIDQQNRLAEGKRLNLFTPDQVDTMERSIKQLNLALDEFGQGTFVNEMNSMFGQNGTLASTMASAAASAILFADSWRDVKNIVNDVIDQITHELLTALIKLGINSALGGAGIGTAPFSFGTLPGRSVGGYTGNIGVNQVAGFHHGQEFVMNAASTRRFRPQLEAMNKGGSGGVGGASVNVNVNNNAPGVDVSTTTDANGDIQIMINKAIAAQVPKMVAGQINDPTSRVSRALGKNLESGRRRM